MLEYLKTYYVFMLILMVFSYLVPKEEYKRYIQFFVGIFIVVLMLKPILEIFSASTPTRIHDLFDSFNAQINRLEWDGKGANIYEYFFLEGKRR